MDRDLEYFKDGSKFATEKKIETILIKLVIKLWN